MAEEKASPMHETQEQGTREEASPHQPPQSSQAGKPSQAVAEQPTQPQAGVSGHPQGEQPSQPQQGPPGPRYRAQDVHPPNTLPGSAPAMSIPQTGLSGPTVTPSSGDDDVFSSSNSPVPGTSGSFSLSQGSAASNVPGNQAASMSSPKRKREDDEYGPRRKRSSGGSQHSGAGSPSEELSMDNLNIVSYRSRVMRVFTTRAAAAQRSPEPTEDLPVDRVQTPRELWDQRQKFEMMEAAENRPGVEPDNVEIKDAEAIAGLRRAAHASVPETSRGAHRQDPPQGQQADAQQVEAMDQSEEQSEADEMEKLEQEAELEMPGDVRAPAPSPETDAEAEEQGGQTPDERMDES